MKILRIASRIIIGLVFMFSGTVKAIDPLGSAYKFHDYFHAFNLGFLNALSLILAVLLCTAEFISGFSVLTGIRYKSGLRGVLILMLIFTPVTLILALTNPVSDCGCFGDAIHLTNWQTFGKNIILFIFLLFLLVGTKNREGIFSAKAEWYTILIVSLIFIGFSLANLRYLPVVDFLPYKIGVKIADKMSIPEGAPADVYNTTFIYEKAGERKEFTITNYPANDSTWKFIDQKSVLVKAGYKPPIHDFAIYTLNGEEITQKILTDSGTTLLMVSKKIGEADKTALSAGLKLGQALSDNGINFYLITSSGKDEIVKIGTNLQVCMADETTLKTMLRANPGFMLIRNGIISGKWSWANVPAEEWFIGLEKRPAPLNKHIE
jgi:hypothetical protein